MVDDDKVPRSNSSRRVFLSYASEDNLVAERIAEKLQTNGIDVWWDQGRIKAGDSLRQKIEEGLEECTHFLVLLTRVSVGKPWVNQEMDSGLIHKLNEKCVFVPVRYQMSAEQLPPLLKGIHSPEIKGNEDIDRLIQDVLESDREPQLGPIAHVRESANRTGSFAFAPKVSQQSGTLMKAAHGFRAKRLKKIKKGKAWSNSSKLPYCVLHWIPLAAMTGEKHVEIASIVDQSDKFIAGPEWDLPLHSVPNPDGLRVFRGIPRDQGQNTGWHVFRGFQYVEILDSGALEAVFAPNIFRAENGVQYISFDLHPFVRAQIHCFLMHAPSLGVPGPVLLGASMLRIKRYAIHVPYDEKERRYANISEPAKKGEYVLPETQIGDVSDMENPEQEIVRPVMDWLCRCFGLLGCEYYDNNGNWEPPAFVDRWTWT